VLDLYLATLPFFAFLLLSVVLIAFWPWLSRVLL
jgi:hypothetical protein